VVFPAATMLAVLGALASLLRDPRPTPYPSSPTGPSPALATKQR
jgi:hypothetical protein